MSTSNPRISKTQLLAYVLLALIIGSFRFQAHRMFMERTSWLMAEVPRPGKHWSDEMVFLRIFQFVENGTPYYQSVLRATVEDRKETSYSTNDVFTWRLPTVFYFWSLLARDGIGIGNLFIVFSSFSLLSVYFIARKFLGPFLSLLSPLFLIPYFLDALYYGPSFLSTEWWGLFFFIPGLCALLYKKTFPATLLLLLAVVTRELFIIHIVFLFLVSLLLKKNRAVFIKILFIFSIFFLVHFLLVQQQHVVSAQSSSLARIHSFSKVLLQQKLAFSMRLYPFLNSRLPLLLFIIPTCALALKLKQKYTDALYLLNSYFPFAVMSMFTGGMYNDYWGILFMPLAIACAPLAITLFASNTRAQRRQYITSQTFRNTIAQ